MSEIPETFKGECDPIKDLTEMVERIKSTKPQTPRYFARDWELKAAIEFFKNTEVIVVDSQGNEWLYGERREE